MTVTLHHGNCLEVIPTLPDCSVDSIVTDPPYELGFMGKKWDASGIAYNITLWQECLRVLKPGGHLLAFGGTRTYHRMACAIEDAGFEIRDSIHWLYGSGFPKSLDVSKAIDKMNGRRFEDRYALGRHIREKREALSITRAEVNAWFGYKDGCEHWERQDPHGARVPTLADWVILRDRLGLSDEWDELVARIEAEREIIGRGSSGVATAFGDGRWATAEEREQSDKKDFDITAPATEQAKQWAGWGTALKPAHEPVVVARKPLVGTVAQNVLEYGTGAINIDGSRIGTTDKIPTTSNQNIRGAAYKGENADRERDTVYEQNQAGRWPANVILDDTIANSHDDWPRYFYCAKPSRRERNTGLDHLPTRRASAMGYDIGLGEAGEGMFKDRNPQKQNHHPTVKPLALMRYLVRLVTPPGGTVLEPFAGSGTTLMACVLENFHAVGIEMTDEYLPIIKGRVAWSEQEANKQQEELDL